jgi:hypothetical protein
MGPGSFLLLLTTSLTGKSAPLCYGPISFQASQHSVSLSPGIEKVLKNLNILEGSKMVVRVGSQKS